MLHVYLIANSNLCSQMGYLEHFNELSTAKDPFYVWSEMSLRVVDLYLGYLKAIVTGYV